MWKVWNVYLDPTKAMLRRRASKLQVEPVINGNRLRLRSSMVLTAEQYENNKANLELFKSWGVVEYAQEGRTDGTPIPPPLVPEVSRVPIKDLEKEAWLSSSDNLDGLVEKKEEETPSETSNEGSPRRGRPKKQQ